MSESASRSSDPVRSVEDPLRRAGDREAARWAAHDLVRAAVEDAVAVSPGADAVVGAVRRLVEQGCPWRADAFAALLYVLQHSYVYRALRADLRTYRGEYADGIAVEEAVFDALAGFDVVVRDVLVDPDPETRSMATLLLSWISTDPCGDRELLRLLIETEPDERTRACIAESLLRLGDASQVEFLSDPSANVRNRIAVYFSAARRSGIPVVSDAVIDALVEDVAREAPGYWRWPAEEL